MWRWFPLRIAVFMFRLHSGSCAFDNLQRLKSARCVSGLHPSGRLEFLPPFPSSQFSFAHLLGLPFSFIIAEKGVPLFDFGSWSLAYVGWASWNTSLNWGHIATYWRSAMTCRRSRRTSRLFGVNVVESPKWIHDMNPHNVVSYEVIYVKISPHWTTAGSCKGE